MEVKSYFYVPLSKKADFNLFVRHIQAVIEVLEDNSNDNVVDIVNDMLSERIIESDQVLPLISVVLRDKWNYRVKTVNLEEVCKDSDKFVSTIAKWKGVDIVLGYQHPDLGFLAINPKNPASKKIIDDFRKNELLHIYVGKKDEAEISDKLANTAIEAVLKLLYNKKVTVSASITSGSFEFKEKIQKKVTKKVDTKKKSTATTARKAPVVKKSTVTSPDTNSDYTVPDYLRKDSEQSSGPIGRKNMSQLISVVVSNELFHNGNVEAWKRIIRSYNAKYPNAEVIIYYDGERIVDINTLFKWGKVKHGSTIQFAVAAEEIKDLSRLRKYFAQGASARFEDFLRGSPDTVLNLF